MVDCDRNHAGRCKQPSGGGGGYWCTPRVHRIQRVGARASRATGARAGAHARVDEAGRAVTRGGGDEASGVARGGCSSVRINSHTRAYRTTQHLRGAQGQPRRARLVGLCRLGRHGGGVGVDQHNLDWLWSAGRVAQGRCQVLPVRATRGSSRPHVAVRAGRTGDATAHSQRQDRQARH